MFRNIIYLKLLKNVRTYYTVKKGDVERNPDALAKQIYAKIKTTGPISVAEYMKEVLINPSTGYYMHKDVFGEGGDFITSPELGQMFGEMVAIWFLNEWSKFGCPKPLQIVELGPGKGSLCQDILRVFDHFKSLKGASLHLVEVSPYLSDLQARKLCMKSEPILDENCVMYKQGLSHEGIPIKWYRHLNDVPTGFTMFVAHEFFDALPVHKFQKTNNGYREILIDIQPGKECTFRHIIAREETPMQKVLIKANESREHLEISPETMVLTKLISNRINQYGGLALIADYGHDGLSKDSFRAFKKHKLHDPLVEPGTADLTADVDFSAIRNAVLEEEGVLVYGPANQRDFLMKIGIESRFNKLAQTVTGDYLEGLKFGYHMIIDEDKMGKRFKFMTILPEVLKKVFEKYPVTGFT